MAVFQDFYIRQVKNAFKQFEFNDVYKTVQATSGALNYLVNLRGIKEESSDD